MKTIVNEEVVVALVEEIQVGNEGKWTDLYSELQRHKSFAVNKSSKKLTGYGTKADVDSLYDDCLMYAVKKFNKDTNSSFTAFLYMIFSSRGIEMFKHATHEKRVINSVSESIEADTFEDGCRKVDLQIDMKAEQQIDSVTEGNQLLTDLAAFSAQSPKVKEQMEIILAQVNSTDENRQTAILSVLPEGTSWASARKKLQRAKEDLKKFLESCHREQI